MKITPDILVGEAVKINFKTAPLFQINNIDYCCGGNKTISEACYEAGIEPGLFITELQKIVENPDPDSDYINSLELGELCDYIVKRHHFYVKKNIPFLKQNLDKICEVHSDKHPELKEIKKLFYQSAGDLIVHLQKEEIMLFPLIKKMAKVKNDAPEIENRDLVSVINPIAIMISDHETEGKRFEKISEISDNYSIPDDACTTYIATFNQLKDFENDLHRHIHLENNILFPKAVNLEAVLKKR